MVSDPVRKEIGENIPIVMGSALIVIPLVMDRFADQDMTAFVSAFLIGLMYGAVSLLLHRFS